MEDKPKEQLIEEIESLRKELAELRQEKTECKRAERLLQALNEASRSMEQALTPDEIFSAVAGELKKLGFSSIVFLTDESQERLFIKYWSYEARAIKAAEKLVGLKQEDFPILIEAVDVYRKAVWEREPVFNEDVKEIVRQILQPALPGPAKKLGGPIGSIAKMLKVSRTIDAPLIMGDKVIGMLSVQSGDLTRDDMPSITAFAYQMAAAWHKATLLQDLKRNLAERKRAEEALQKAHDELERRVEERTAELVKSNEQLTREITERKRTEEELRSSEQRLKILFEFAPDAYYLNDLKGNFVDGNKAAEEITGYKREELSGKSFLKLKLLSASQIPKAAALLAKSALGQATGPDEFTLTRKDGTKVQPEISTFPVEIKGRTLVLGIARDITERKRAEESLRKAEEDWRSSFNSLEDVMLIIDRDYNIENMNDSGLALLGKSREEVIGRKCYQVISGADSPPDNCPCKQSLKTKKVESVDRYEERFGKYFSIKTSPIFDENGEIMKFVDLRCDITERKRAAEALRKSEEKYRKQFEGALDAIFIADAETGIIVDCNRAACELVGKEKSELVGKHQRELHPPGKIGGEFTKTFKQHQKEKEGQVLETQVITKKGEIKDVAIKASSFELEGKKVLLGIFRDITERKRAEEALRESVSRYRTLIESSHEVIFCKDQGGHYHTLNLNAAIGLGGRCIEDIEGKTDYDLLPKEQADALRKTDIQLMEDGGDIEVEEVVRNAEGKDRIYLSHKWPLLDDEGRITGISCFALDITERKQAEEEIKIQRAHFKSIFDYSREGIVTLDINNNILDANLGFENIYGYKVEEIRGKRLDDLIVPKRFYHTEAKELHKMALDGVLGYETIRKRKDGREINVSLSAGPIKIGGKTGGRFVIFGDITERKKAEEQLEHSFVDLAETVSRAMSSRDPYTAGHQQRVAELARLVGEKMGLDKDRIQGLYIGGLLHDIGKISTPESILSKPGKLADEEWALIHAHAKQGYEILKDTNLPWPVADMALHHHERLDGSGYPHGISGDKLSLENRILGVCDVVEAMSSHRPYRPARSKEEVLQEIKGGRGTKYDANVVDVMLQIIENGEFEFG